MKEAEVKDKKIIKKKGNIKMMMKRQKFKEIQRFLYKLKEKSRMVLLIKKKYLNNK